MSALITAEWYMRKNHFPGWARPFEFNALLYDSIGRHEEARDGVSLLPLWQAVMTHRQNILRYVRWAVRKAASERKLHALTSLLLLPASNGMYLESLATELRLRHNHMQPVRCT